MSDMDGGEGACIKCGYEDELDNRDMCTHCRPPINLSHGQIIIDRLARERKEKEERHG